VAIDMTQTRHPGDPVRGLAALTHGFYPPAMVPPAGFAAVDFAALSPLQRGLLVIDGTVTTFLEAVGADPIRIVPLGQRLVALSADLPGLAAPAGTMVLERAVALVGEATSRVHALADSTIVPGRLPPAVRQALEAGTIGIGQALRAPGFATRREGLWFGRGRRPVPAALAGGASGDFLVRCYRVSTGGGDPAMVITEFFPWELPG
jgi:chorismate-pyruvate lyase